VKVTINIKTTLRDKHCAINCPCIGGVTFNGWGGLTITANCICNVDGTRKRLYFNPKTGKILKSLDCPTLKGVK
jgi:hypothetical protein